MSVDLANWGVDTVSPMSLILDPDNPRVDSVFSTSQDRIRAYLLETAGVAELSKNIADSGGLMRGERVIVVKVDDNYVVLEGNRRVCACQLLLDPDLIPKRYKNAIPGASTTLKSFIDPIDVDVAPSRASAEWIISKRHTSPGIMPWVLPLTLPGRKHPEIADRTTEVTRPAFC